uniref:Putative conserved secreted protein n=1 Tax=Amblyomma sculptum TaxID=1581419 RepID=A0A1E1XU23_AMBSC
MFLVWVLVTCLNNSCSDPPAGARPSWPAAEAAATALGDCLPASEVRALCQRCAKITKNAKAYRMCCTDDAGNSTESGRTYCKRLLDHTVGSLGDDFLARGRTVTPIL